MVMVEDYDIDPLINNHNRFNHTIMNQMSLKSGAHMLLSCISPIADNGESVVLFSLIYTVSADYEKVEDLKIYNQPIIYSHTFHCQVDNGKEARPQTMGPHLLHRCRPGAYRCRL
jgi:hypothetical protein